jgi:hypothetical protein
MVELGHQPSDAIEAETDSEAAALGERADRIGIGEVGLGQSTASS